LHEKLIEVCINKINDLAACSPAPLTNSAFLVGSPDHGWSTFSDTKNQNDERLLTQKHLYAVYLGPTTTDGLTRESRGTGLKQDTDNETTEENTCLEGLFFCVINLDHVIRLVLYCGTQTSKSSTLQQVMMSYTYCSISFLNMNAPLCRWCEKLEVI
jgi:hypothetical protein